MGMIRGKVETIISLTKSTCYFMKTGKCSLNMVKDFAASDAVTAAPDELLYCPRLLHSMQQAEKPASIAVIPCDCGHAEVVNGHQRACIAEQRNLVLEFVDAEKDHKAACCLCEGQLSFDENAGLRIVTVRACIDDSEKNQK